MSIGAHQLKTIGQLKNVLIWTAGGPGSGKTTLLHNLSSIMKNDYDQNIDNMLVIGNTLLGSLQISANGIDQILADCAPIMIDNRCIDEQLIADVVKFAKKNAYKTILIYPWIDYTTFCKRLSDRKQETGRDYKLAQFWKKHLIFHKNLYKYIRSSSCPFDICLVYNNNNDLEKPVIYAKIMQQCYLLDRNFLNQINHKDNDDLILKKKNLVDNQNQDKGHSFVPNQSYLSSQLKFIFNCLFTDIISQPMGQSLNFYIKGLVETHDETR